MTVREKLRGIIVPLVTPFDEDGALASQRAGALIEHNVRLGVHGLYTGGSTGEGFLQSVDERIHYLEYVASVVAGRIPIIAQVGALAARDAWTLTDAAAACGYDAVASTVPFYFNFTEREIIAYYRELAERSPVPVLLYNVPSTTSRRLLITSQIELLRLPNVIGSKHTDTDLYAAERLMAEVAGSILLFGVDEMLLAGLALGMAGGIGSTYNLMPRQYLALYQDVMQGRLAAARRRQRRINAVVHEMLRISPGCVPAIKLGLRLLGYDMGPPRKPFQEISGDTSRFEHLLRASQDLVDSDVDEPGAA